MGRDVGLLIWSPRFEVQQTITQPGPPTSNATTSGSLGWNGGEDYESQSIPLCQSTGLLLPGGPSFLGYGFYEMDKHCLPIRQRHPNPPWNYGGELLDSGEAIPDSARIVRLPCWDCPSGLAYFTERRDN